MFVPVIDFPEGTRTAFARAVAAEVRARIAAVRTTQRELAAGAGFASHNYLAIRLRDEKPFTLDDIDMLCAYWEIDPIPFLQAAYDNHSERIWTTSLDAHRRRSRMQQIDDQAARTEDDSKGKD